MDSVSEPTPRWGHFTAVVQRKLYLWGGYTKDFLEGKNKLSSYLHSFDQFSESWTKMECNEVPPPALFAGACTSAGHYFYVYGGGSESCYQSSLYQLDTRTQTWKQLSSAGPTAVVGCGLVAYDSKLVLFGGYGWPTHLPGRWCAEHYRVLTFDLKKGECSPH